MRPSEELRTKTVDLDNLMREFLPYGIRNLRVFGSVARGEDTIESDIDFAVDIERGINGRFPGFKYFEFVERLESTFISHVHLTDFTSCPEFLQKAIQEDEKHYDEI